MSPYQTKEWVTSLENVYTVFQDVKNNKSDRLSWNEKLHEKP